MPFRSEAQRRKFYATPALRKFIPEFNAATAKGEKLPDHVSPVTHALKRKHHHKHRRHHR